ncbi:MAG: TetR family transcriptional regulator [Streptosporangiales bacterium]|nr:TetR family transcriptional regulator [Streptosporangiales bacterium]
MPPAFGTGERERIDAILCDAARRLFTTQGLRKTSLDELVRPAGIAKSSFYAFYPSKEELYIELMFREVPALQARLLDRLFEESGDTADAIRRFLYGVLDIQQNNALYHRLVTHPDELEAVSRRLTPGRLEEAKQLVTGPIIEFIERAQRDGELVDAEPDVVLGVMQAVMLVPLEAHRLDPATYPQALEMLIDLVATGLTRQGATGGGRRRSASR